jgi:hypothetical protein
VEGIVGSFGGLVVSSCGVLLSHLVGVIVVAISVVASILLCRLSFGKLFLSPYDRDKTLEV